MTFPQELPLLWLQMLLFGVWVPLSQVYGIIGFNSYTGCDGVLCENGGNATEKLHECTCQCPDGFYGQFCENDCRFVSGTWPTGSYALLETVYGCPEVCGWEQQRLSLSLNQGAPGHPIMLKGKTLGYRSSRNIQLHLCSRRSAESGERNVLWPKGQYCVFQAAATCPDGLKPGSIHLDTYVAQEKLQWGPLEHVNGSSQEMYLKFCCQLEVSSSGSEPTGRFPFQLFKRKEGECPVFKGSAAYEEYLYLSTKNTSFSGHIPSLNVTGSVARLTVCHYEFPQGCSASQWTCDNGQCIPGWKRCNYVTDCSDVSDEKYCKNAAHLKPVRASHVAIGHLSSLVDQSDVYVNLAIGGRAKDRQPWLQVNLLTSYVIGGIQMSLPYGTKIKNAAIYIGNSAWDFKTNEAHACFMDLTVPVPTRLIKIYRKCKTRLIGQYITVENNAGSAVELRMWELRIFSQEMDCGRPMGMISGEISDFQISASTEQDGHEAVKGRLNSRSGWCARLDDPNPFIQVDFIVAMRLQAIDIQGWYDRREERFIDNFQISSSMDGTTFTDLAMSSGDSLIFRQHLYGNDITFPWRFKFHKDIVARVLRVHVRNAKGSACLSMETIGCQMRLVRDLSCAGKHRQFGWEIHKNHRFQGIFMHSFKNVSLNSCILKWSEAGVKAHALVFNENQSMCSLYVPSIYDPDYFSMLRPAIGSMYAQPICITRIERIRICGGRLLINGSGLFKTPSFPLYYGQGLECKYEIIASNVGTGVVRIQSRSIRLPERDTKIQGTGSYIADPGQCTETVLLKAFRNVALRTVTAANQKSETGVVIIGATSYVFIDITSCFHIKPLPRPLLYGLSVKYEVTEGCAGCSVGETQMIGSAKRCYYKCSFIASMNYPVAYPPMLRQIWEISTKFGVRYIELQFLELSVEGIRGCQADFVEVFDFDITQKKPTSLGKFCTGYPPSVKLRSSWSKLQIEFASNSIRNLRGFLAKAYVKEVTITQPTITNVTGVTCAQGWVQYDLSCYKIVHYNEAKDWVAVLSARHTSGGMTWFQAETACRSQGGHLVSINTEAEMKFVRRKLLEDIAKSSSYNRYADVYIGLRDRKYDGNFTWSDGKPLTYTAWSLGTSGFSNPDGPSMKGCGKIQLSNIHTMKYWTNIRCASSTVKHLVCEVEHAIKDSKGLVGTIQLVSKEREKKLRLYKCTSGEYISELYQCNGVPDCMNGSDENNCASRCPMSSFRCMSGQCISLASYCDFVKDCTDGTDESGCVYGPCKSSEWRCKSGQCIDSRLRCNFIKNCLDGSDEDLCNKYANGTSYQCFNARHIPISQKCDKTIDCPGEDFEDERLSACANKFVWVQTCRDWRKLGFTEDGKYHVVSPLSSTYIAYVHCEMNGENDDIVTVFYDNANGPFIFSNITNIRGLYYEILLPYRNLEAWLKKYDRCEQKVTFECNRASYASNQIGYFYWAKDRGIWKTLYDPSDNKCSCYLKGACQDANRTQCWCQETAASMFLDGDRTYKDYGVITDMKMLPIRNLFHRAKPGNWRSSVNIGPLKCYQKFNVNDTLIKCDNTQRVSLIHRCLYDRSELGTPTGCRDMTHLKNCENFKCPVNYKKCPNSYCIPLRRICDSVKDCSNGEDEMNCGSWVCKNSYRCHHSTICASAEQLCDGRPHCPEGDDEHSCNITCPSQCTCKWLSFSCTHQRMTSLPQNISPLARYLNVAYNRINMTTIDLRKFTSLAKLNMSSNNISFIRYDTFQGLRNLIAIDLSWNRIQIIVNRTFSGLINTRELYLRGNPLLGVIEVGAFHGLANLPILDLSSTQINSIAKNNFHGLKQLRRLVLKNTGLSEVEDKSFATLSNLKYLDISGNKMKLFQSNMFNGLYNLVELRTDAYKFCCIRPTSVKESNCYPPKDEFSSCDDLMRSNILRTFLWILGLFALVGNSFVIIWRLSMEPETLKRPNGLLIFSLSISDLLMGIHLISIAIVDSVYRGTYIWHDEYWRTNPFCTTLGVIAAVSCEASVFTLTLITLDRVISLRFPMSDYRFTYNRTKIAVAITWSVAITVAIIPILPLSYFEGRFYTRTGVCLALPLARNKTAGWQYSMAIFTFVNFLAFLVIAAGQISIYLKIQSSGRAVGRKNTSKELIIARKLLLIVFTDFCCWFPITVMGIMVLLGYVFPGETYAWVAVLVLPVNSAINPVIYSISCIDFSKLRRKGSTSEKQSFASSVKSARQQVTEIIDILRSDRQLQLSVYRRGLTTLKEIMTDEHLISPRHILTISTGIAKALFSLHAMGYVHPDITTENILLEYKKKGVQDVRLTGRITDAEDMATQAKDIHDLGKLITKIMRHYQFQKHRREVEATNGTNIVPVAEDHL